MALSINLKFPPNIIHSSKVRKTLYDIGSFVRDLWVSRSPYRTGQYVAGLMNTNSVKIGSGQIIITNFCPYAENYEYGHKSFNLAQKILAAGKGVKLSKDGYRYKVLRIPRATQTRFKSPRLADSVRKAFSNTIPKTIKGKVDKLIYTPPKRLGKPMARKFKAGGPIGLFVISEKTQRENPGKWQMPALAPKYLARSIQREVMPIINEAIQKAIAEMPSKPQAPRKPITATKPVVPEKKRRA